MSRRGLILKKIVKCTSYLDFFETLDSDPLFRDKDIHRRVCSRLKFSYRQKGDVVIIISKNPKNRNFDFFSFLDDIPRDLFTILKGSVLIFVPRTVVEVRRERGCLEAFLKFLRMYYDFKEHRVFDLNKCVDERHFSEFQLQMMSNWERCKPKIEFLGELNLMIFGGFGWVWASVEDISEAFNSYMGVGINLDNLFRCIFAIFRFC